MRRLTHALLACVPLMTMEYDIAPDFMPQTRATVKIEIAWCQGASGPANGVVEIKRQLFAIEKPIGQPDIQYLRITGQPGVDPDAYERIGQ